MDKAKRRKWRKTKRERERERKGEMQREGERERVIHFISLMYMCTWFQCLVVSTSLRYFYNISSNCVCLDKVSELVYT